MSGYNQLYASVAVYLFDFTIQHPSKTPNIVPIPTFHVSVMQNSHEKIITHEYV